MKGHIFELRRNVFISFVPSASLLNASCWKPIKPNGRVSCLIMSWPTAVVWNPAVFFNAKCYGGEQTLDTAATDILNN